jgi:hypothetical protein
MIRSVPSVIDRSINAQCPPPRPTLAREIPPNRIRCLERTDTTESASNDETQAGYQLQAITGAGPGAASVEMIRNSQARRQTWRGSLPLLLLPQSMIGVVPWPRRPAIDSSGHTGAHCCQQRGRFLRNFGGDVAKLRSKG